MDDLGNTSHACEKVSSWEHVDVYLTSSFPFAAVSNLATVSYGFRAMDMVVVTSHGYGGCDQPWIWWL